MRARVAEVANVSRRWNNWASRPAATLPPLSPSRDLWFGIEQRLGTPVVSIGPASAGSVTRARTVSFRMLAAAAVLLVSLSSGATYVVTRGARVTPPAPATVAIVPSPIVAPAVVAAASETSPTKPSANSATTRDVKSPAGPTGRVEVATGAEPGARFIARYASRVQNSTNFAAEREITAMRRIVDARLGDLDSVTVVEIGRNLRIIDKAINDGRRALQNDPRSGFLSKQFDHALANRLDIMRRIALL